MNDRRRTIKESKALVGHQDTDNFVHDRRIDEQNHRRGLMDQEDEDFDLGINELKRAASSFHEDMASTEKEKKAMCCVMDILLRFHSFIRGFNMKQMSLYDLSLKRYSDMSVLKFKLVYSPFYLQHLA